MTIESWEIQVEILGKTKSIDVPTFAAAQEFVRKLHEGMTAKATLPSNDLEFIINSINRATIERSAQMGGWAAASYTPPWRIAILPTPPMGHTLAELRAAA